MTTILYTFNTIYGVPFYVGITTNLKSRIKTHNYKNKTSDKYLYKKLRKLGYNNYKLIVHNEYPTWKDACKAERTMIKQLKSEGIKLCNLTDGGEGNFGWHPSKETIEKIKRNQTLLYGKNNPFYGKHHTNITKSILKNKCANYGDSNGFYGKTHSAETKKKWSIKRGIKIKQLSMDNKLIRVWNSKRDIMNELHIDFRTIINNNYIYKEYKWMVI